MELLEARFADLKAMTDAQLSDLRRMLEDVRATERGPWRGGEGGPRVNQQTSENPE